MAMQDAETDPINLSEQLISSLVHQIPLIQNFKGKWSLIRAKLADLQTQLAVFSADAPRCSSNSLSVDLILSVSHTLKDAVSLAQSCQSVSFSQGKLKTQSEVDSLLTKLDLHVKNCEIFLRSRVINEGSVSGSSKREAVRSELRSLITCLQIGSSDSRNSAMKSILDLLQEDDKNVMLAVAQGVVPVLVRLLDSNSAEMKDKTVSAISRISMVDSSKHVLIAEGLFLSNQLLRVLDCGSGFAKEKACVALQALIFSKEKAREIGSRGGVASLLDICRAGTPGSQASAARVLRNMAVFKEIREIFLEENAITVLLGLAASGTSLARENAFGCLANLVSEEESLKLLVVKEGGIECLKDYWNSPPAIRSLEVAVELLSHLASCPPIGEVLITEGFTDRLVGVLNCGVLGVRIAAVRAVRALGFNSKTRKGIGECGCIILLIRMLDGKAVEEKEEAAKTLSILMQCHSNRRIFCKDENGIASVVQLLDHSIQNLDKKYPVSILASLVHSKKWRRQMVSAGANVYTQKLVEMNVEGSKKLADNLGHNKIWGVFPRPF